MRKLTLLIIMLFLIPTICFGACDSQTVLMLHLDGTDGSTTITDDSPSAHSMTANGNMQIDTAQSKFGGASGLFDGSGDYISASDDPDWDLGTGDFTIDFWIRFAAAGNMQQLDFASLKYGIEMYQAAGTLDFVVNGGDNSQTVAGFSLDTWIHIAIVRTGTTVKFFKDGTQYGSDMTISTDLTGTGSITIGTRNNGSTQPMNGWLDEYRISKGVARWTSDFTPPTSAYCGASASPTHTFFQVLQDA